MMNIPRCKICGTAFTISTTVLGGVTIAPNCKCGSIRQKARESHCGSCGATGEQINVRRLDFNTYEIYCETCGNKWEAKE